MDPLTQGTLGAALAQSLAKSKGFRSAALAGLVGGLLPDADVFIRSTEDPLMFLVFHRHFTHSLIFIPFGGLVAALICWPFLRRHLGLAHIFLYTCLGYATHGLLDACTSYGTQLLWPLSNMRVAWGSVSVVDPLFTLPLLFITVMAVIRKSAFIGRLGIVYGLCYLSLGFLQHGRAMDEGMKLADSRGHAVDRMSVHPSFGNLIVWRIVYESGGMLHASAVRLLPFSSDVKLYEGASAPKYCPAENTFGYSKNDIAYEDIKRFQHFSDDWLILSKADAPYIIGDARYSTIPSKLSPIWGISIDPELKDAHTPYVTMRKDREASLDRLWQLIKGESSDQ